MITLHQYFMGRDVEYRHLLTPELRENAATTVYKANRLLDAALGAGVYLDLDPVTGSLVSSGWRPPAVNANTPNAARRSKHMTCQAVDINDDNGELDEWCMSNEKYMEEVGVWLENPSATKGWTHWQIVPPKSGRRIFYP
jgi:hypothetical protein